MKKIVKIVIIVLLVPFLYACPIAFEQPFPTNYYTFKLNRDEWIVIQPKKDIYKVGDTIQITYKIPNKIGKFETSHLLKDTANYRLSEHIEKIAMGVGFVRANSGANKILRAFINNKEYKEQTEMWDINYHFDTTKDEYSCTIKVIFLKPEDFYWAEGFNPKYILPSNEILDRSSPDEEGCIIDFIPNDKNDLAFKVVE